MENSKNLTIVETFVGAGGSHIGFKKAGFKTIFVNDIWETALKTLKNNNSELSDDQILCQDISKLNCDKLKNDFPELKSLDVLMGGVVCKGFSLAGVRNPFDERNYLYLDQLKLVKEFKPKISVIENVPGMLSMNILKNTKTNIDFKYLDNLFEELKLLRGKKIAIQKNIEKNEENSNYKKELEELNIKTNELIEKRDKLKYDLSHLMYNVVEDIEKIYDEIGYKTYKKILCCADFGGFTYRKRLFIVAVRKDINKIWTFPEKTTEKENWKTVRDAFSLLNSSNDPSIDIDNRPMKHSLNTIEKFKKIKSEKNNDTNKYFSRGSSQRLSFDKTAPTLVPGHSAFQIHPVEHRSITIREGATITGFPIDYKFYGSHSDKCMQIGNAIPIHLSYAIANQVKIFLDDI